MPVPAPVTRAIRGVVCEVAFMAFPFPGRSPAGYIAAPETDMEPDGFGEVIKAGPLETSGSTQAMPAILMWLIGIPIPIILILYLLT